MITGSEIEEHRFEIRLDRRELGHVEALIRQQPSDDRKIQALVAEADLEQSTGQRFDVVVLDPAKQTRDRDEIDYALKRYYDMNRLALQAVAPGGIYLTCSCTGLVSEESFLQTIRRSAYQAGRTVQILRIAGAGADHPFHVHVPESRYLTAVFCRVE